jgi:3-keto-5-aminohexanoate cleavage enzyme
MSDKLIITVAPTDGFTYSTSDFPAIPDSVEKIAQAAGEAYDAGAAIAHLHGPWNAPQGGVPTLDADGWARMGRLVRERCPDAIVQFGVAGAPIAQRALQLEADLPERPDMMSVCLTEHDYNFAGKEIYIMHTRPELVEYAQVCERAGVKPEFEVFHIGAYYNLRYIDEHSDGALPKPHWLTQFIGSTGGVWTPHTMDELDYRIRHMPDDCLWQVCPRSGVKGAMSATRYWEFIAESILRGGHVRVGVEDNPYIADGEKASSSAQYVERVVKIAEALGREVASPAEARQILGME